MGRSRCCSTRFSVARSSLDDASLRCGPDHWELNVVDPGRIFAAIVFGDMGGVIRQSPCGTFDLPCKD
jgi:hypothetical protein